MTEQNNIKLIDAVERYIMGDMNPDERLHFENLRKADSEVDQMVVEHTLFLQKMNRFNEWEKFHTSLQEVHNSLSGQGKLNDERLAGKAKVVYLFNRFKKTAAIAASIAGLTALIVSIVASSVTPKTAGNQFEILKKDISTLEHKARIQAREINNLKQKDAAATSIEIPYTKGGTGFMIDGNGFIVTNNHVIEKSNNVAVQNNEGKEFIAKVVYTDPAKDIAILKIDDTDFKALPGVPYSFSKKAGLLAEPIFTLGYPREEIQYDQGYLSSRTGYNGDTLSFQIGISANRGNSGSPILNQNGEVMGILNGRQKDVTGSAFAIRSRNILSAIDELRQKPNSDSTVKNIKLNTKNTLAGLNRTQQAKKIQDYIYMVKVN